MEILDLASNILKEENHKKGLCGSILPSTILEYANVNQMLPIPMAVPKNACGVNVHLLKSKDSFHYVLSHKLFVSSNSTFRIYDSLPPGKKVWHQRLKDLPLQLKMIYGDIPNNVNDIEVVCAQSQGYHSCSRNKSGLYALSNCLMISNQQDPCKFKLSKNMRG